MILEILEESLYPKVRELLSYATSSERVEQVYNQYILMENQYLFGFMDNENMMGCIGLEIESGFCEIKHIAVMPQVRGAGIGSQLIDWVFEKFPFNKLMAETDHDSVDFYRKYGFEITTLGEKYPGVERFLCEYER